jgi:nucleotide-binding universal stress UspA family protein
MTRHPRPRIERVVVGVDFSDPSLHAARWAARHFAPGAELLLVHVIHLPPDPLSIGGHSSQRERALETARAAAEIRLRELSDSIAARLIPPEIRVGTPDEEIVRVAGEYDADLVVIGRRGGRAGVRGWMGTTAQRVVRRSTVPVLVAREQTGGDTNGVVSRVLIAVDDSDVATTVLEWGQHLTEQLSAGATVLHALDTSHCPSVAAPRGASAGVGIYVPRHGPPAADGHAGYAARWLAGRVREVAGSERMTPCVVARPSSHAEVIIAEAEIRRAELIVLGSVGAGAVFRSRLGSVADRVLLCASCAVLVVPGSTRTVRRRATPCNAIALQGSE